MSINHIKKFNSAGTHLLEWGSSGSGDGQFNGPQGIAVDSLGNVYVADFGNYRIQEFNSEGGFLQKWDANGTAPLRLAVDSLGNVYVADSWNSIDKYSNAGVHLHSWWDFTSSSLIAVDSLDFFYVADDADNIRKYNGDGVYITEFGGFGVGDGQFYNPGGIAFDGAGNVYVLDSGNNRIQKFRITGTTPDPFTFAAQTGVALNTSVDSNTIIVSGISAAATISITGCTGAQCQYSINGAWSSAPTVNNGDRVQLRLTSSGSYLTPATATLTIGGVSGTFSVTTVENPVDTKPDPFQFGTANGFNMRNTPLPSIPIQVSGMDALARAPIDITVCTSTKCEYNINDGAWTSAHGTVQNGDNVRVQLTSSPDYATTTIATLTIGGVSGTWSVITIASPGDSTPDPFAFTAQTGVALNTPVVSSDVIVSGISVPAPISFIDCSSALCEYSINWGGYTSDAGMINNGDRVTVRQTSSGSYLTTTIATLSIGGVSGSFSATTLAGVTHTVIPSAVGNGSISPSSHQTVNTNDAVPFTITPADDNHTAAVGGTCGGMLSGSTFTTSPVTADCTVVASFASNGPGNSVPVGGGPVTVTPDPSVTVTFDSVTGNGTIAVTEIDNPSVSLPSGFTLAGKAYEVTTNAGYTLPIIVISTGEPPS